VLSPFPTFQLSAITDDRISIFRGQNVSIQIAFDGVHFQDALHKPVPVIERKRVLSTLHLYPNSWTSEIGWEYAIHVGLLQAVLRYTMVAVQYTEVNHADLTPAGIEKYVSEGQYDIVFIWKWEFAEKTIDPVAVKYPKIQFVISGPGDVFSQNPSESISSTNPKVLNNTNYIFGNIYHGRYLSGVLVGLMMKEGSLLLLKLS
jgi:hypothetical protein